MLMDGTIPGWFPSSCASYVVFIMYIVLCQSSILLIVSCNTDCTFSKIKKKNY